MSINLDNNNHCLFCLRPIPQRMKNDRVTSSGGGSNNKDPSEVYVPNLQSLCDNLEVSWPETNNDMSLNTISSEAVLCPGCNVVAGDLTKLCEELANIQKKVGQLREEIKGVVIKSECQKKPRRERKCTRTSNWTKFMALFRELVAAKVFLTTGPGKNQTENGNGPKDLTSMPKPNSTENSGLVQKRGRRKRTCTDITPVGRPKMRKAAAIVKPEEDDELETPSFLEDEDGSDREQEQGSEAKHPSKQSRRKTTFISRNSDKPKRKRMIATAPTSITVGTNDPTLPFKCTECDLYFAKYQHRYVHIRKCHPKKLTSLSALSSTITTINPEAKTCGRTQIRVKVCTICNKHVKEKSSKLLNYMEHMLSHENESLSPTPSFPCTKCDKTFHLEINLKLHTACIHESRQIIIKCNECKIYTIFGTGEELIEHLKSEHPPGPIYSCRHCPLSYLSLTKLVLHMKKHAKSKHLMCPVCGVVHITMQEVRKHCLETHLPLLETLTCEPCNKKYLEEKHYREHMLIEHAFDPRTNSSLNTTTPDGNSLICPQCTSDKVYKSDYALAQHIKNWHEQRKQFRCERCPGERNFSSKAGLQNHIETIHEVIRYPCPHCSKLYSTTYDLNYHLKTHTGEGLHECPVCSKQFMTAYLLKRHKGIHEEPNPEDIRVCDECGKELNSKAKLGSHKRRVHPKQLLTCEFCKGVFKTKDHFKKHMKNNHASDDGIKS